MCVIFGYQGYQEIDVGEIRGIGKLSVHHTDKLIQEILEFLNAYDGMLHDFAGCRLYSIEFELNQFEKKNDARIMPKSMLFVPGGHKNSNSLLLVLAPQLSLMEAVKPKGAVDDICKLMFQIEEVVDINELKQEQKRVLLQNFAHRFALKLQGDVIETRWNRKLVGLREESKEMPYLTLNLESRRDWKRREISVQNPRFGYPRLRLSDENKFEFMKYSINPSTAFTIAKSSFQLGANLLKIANTGTVDDTQKQFLILFLNIFNEKMQQINQRVDFDRFIQNMKNFIQEVAAWIKEFTEVYQKYIKTIALRSFKDIQADYRERFQKNKDRSLKDKFLYYMGEIVLKHIEYTRYAFHSYDKIRSGELQSPLLYIIESTGDVIHKIERVYQYYLQYFYYGGMTSELIKLLYKNLYSIDNSSIIILGEKILARFKVHLEMEYELQSNQILARNQVHLLMEYKKVAKNFIEPFIATVQLEIQDLLDFCAKKFEDNPEYVKIITKLSSFKEEIEFIWDFILRNSTLQRFLKEFPEDLELNPANFGSEFVRFLSTRRIAAFNLNWRDVLLGYISEISAHNQSQYDYDKAQGQPWSKNKTISQFIEAISNRVKKETTLEGFIDPMKNYIDKLAMENINNRDMVQIYNTYIEGLEILDQFPDYIRQIFYISIEHFSSYNKTFPFSEIIGRVRSIEEMISFEMKELKEKFSVETSLYSYLVEEEMKYFSSLLAFPITLNLISLEKPADFDGPITHKLEFQNLKNNFVKLTLSTNFHGHPKEANSQ